MPEGPECRKIGKQLAMRVSGRKLKGIEVIKGRYVDRVMSGLDSILNDLPTEIIGSGVHGKFIYFILKGEWSLWNTLGTTGSWSSNRTEHSRVRLALDDGDIFFNDMRNFGTLKFVQGKYRLVEKLESLGPDMLVDDIADGDFIQRFREYNHWQITTAMTNQAIISGVGNYLKCDALWMAKINPHRIVKDLSDQELSLLSSSIKRIMKENLEHDDPVYDSLRSTPEIIGEYKKKYLVYNQKHDSDGNDVVRELTQDNKTTHWCPQIQK